MLSGCAYTIIMMYASTKMVRLTSNYAHAVSASELSVQQLDFFVEGMTLCMIS